MMGKNTRIYDRFDWWSVDDCSCEHCLHYAGKDRPCPLEACCCDDVRREAIRREQGATTVHTGGIFTPSDGGDP